MKNRKPSHPIPWTSEQDARLTELWLGDELLKNHIDEFSGHTYEAMIRRACDLKLGKRQNMPRGQVSVSWKLIETEIMKRPAHRFDIAERINLHHATVHKHIERNRNKVHVIDWDRRTNDGSAIPVYALGPGKDVPKPEPITKAEVSRRIRERQRIARHCAGRAVKGINPFAAAAGLIKAPSGAKGTVYKHLVDHEIDELEEA